MLYPYPGLGDGGTFLAQSFNRNSVIRVWDRYWWSIRHFSRYWCMVRKLCVGAGDFGAGGCQSIFVQQNKAKQSLNMISLVM